MKNIMRTAQIKGIVLGLLLLLLPMGHIRAMAVEKLQISGTSLQTTAGEAVQLKGVSTHGIAWFPEYVNKEAFASVKTWGCNTVRLALYPDEYAGYCNGGDQTKLKNLIHQGVSYAKDLDMYVIIDWHVLGEQTPVKHKKAAKTFFQEMAATYKDCPNVLFEICNEPNGGTDWKTIKSYAQEIIRTIRDQGSEAVILVGTPNWSQDVDVAADSPITGEKNIAYSLHFYADTHRDWLRQKAQHALDAGLPLFVTEFGICDASGGGQVNTAEANTWMNFLDKHKISHVMWALSNKNETCSLIQSSCKKTAGWTEQDLSKSGKWYVKHLGGKAKAASTKKQTKAKSKKSAAKKKAGWVKKGKHYLYRQANGKYARKRWIKQGKQYFYVDKRGYRKTGWLKLGKKRYYLSKKGVRLTGRQKIRGKWYSFKANGQLKKA